MKQRIIISIIGTVTMIITSVLGYNINKNVNVSEKENEIKNLDVNQTQIDSYKAVEEIANEIKKAEESQDQTEIGKEEENAKNEITTKGNQEPKTTNQVSKQVTLAEETENKTTTKNQNQETSTSNQTQADSNEITSNNDEECEWQENFLDDENEKITKFTIYEENFKGIIFGGYCTRYNYVEVDLEKNIATLKEHVDLFDNTEEEDYDSVINVKKISSSNARTLEDLYYQHSEINPISSREYVEKMIGIDEGWRSDDETWEEYNERITVYSINHNGQKLYIFGTNWVRMLSYLFE